MQDNSLVIVIVGPTCSGKSNLAIELAIRLDCEIINADLMQMYGGLDICTAKVTQEEERHVRHHLLRVLPPFTQFKPTTFITMAVNCVNEIHSRGKGAIVVGGTGYYISAFLFQNFLLSECVDDSEQLPDFDLDEDSSTDYSMDHLRSLDPTTASTLFPTDLRKIKSSIQFIKRNKNKRRSEIETRRCRQRLSDDCKPLDEALIDCQQDAVDSSQASSIKPRFPKSFLICTGMSSNDLQVKISLRVDKMKACGLRHEVNEMWSRYLTEFPTADSSIADNLPGILQSIGFKEFLSYLKNGLSDVDFEDACERVKLKTWQYAKRQKKWILKKLIPMSAEIFPLSNIDATSLTDEMMESTCKAVLENVASDHTSNYACRITTEAKPLICRTCDVCHKMTKGEEQWLIHTRGKGHKALMRRKRKLEANENKQVEAI